MQKLGNLRLCGSMGVWVWHFWGQRCNTVIEKLDICCATLHLSWSRSGAAAAAATMRIQQQQPAAATADALVAALDQSRASCYQLRCQWDFSRLSLPRLSMCLFNGVQMRSVATAVLAGQSQSAMETLHSVCSLALAEMHCMPPCLYAG